MERSSDQLITKLNILFSKQDYDQIIQLLPYSKLAKLKESELYTIRSRAHSKLKSFDLAYRYAQRAIELNPMSAIAYVARADSFDKPDQYITGIEDYDTAISLDKTLWEAFVGRGYYYSQLGQYERAIRDFSEAIQLRSDDASLYSKRARAYYDSKQFGEAIKDYSKAISLNEKSATYFIGRGNAYFQEDFIDKAYEDYKIASSLEPNNFTSLYNLGLLYNEQRQYEKAIAVLTRSLQIKDDHPRAYNTRATAFFELNKYAEAIEDYEKYISLETDFESYSVKLAKSQILELTQKLENSWYENIDKTVSEIKSILLFDEVCLTHFTSLSASTSMILEDSLFRLSEGNFLNDTSEGRELFKFLEYSVVKITDDETLAKPFTERPFIGSFVADSKHDDLTLWRMYGKEAMTEAKGCALTINREAFVKNLERSLGVNDETGNTARQQDSKFIFYKVAYCNQIKFRIPGGAKGQENKLNGLMRNLKTLVNDLTDEQREKIARLLNGIAYLFKTADYQYENEVRLVVSGVGFKKNFQTTSGAPRVYIELINIIPVLHKLTLGPKVERPDEWAAAFSYKIDELEPDREQKVEIVISRLPFK